MPRYYDRDYRPTYPVRPPATGWIPGAYMGAAPMYGWGWWGGAWDGPWYGYEFNDMPAGMRRPRARPPRESPMYGRGGDEGARRWAQRYGYDFEYEIRP